MTGPKMLDGKAIEGTFHSHQVPIEAPRENPSHLAALEDWLRSYRPEELFGADGTPCSDILALLPRAERRLGRCPQANGGRLLRPLDLAPSSAFAVAVEQPGAVLTESTTHLGVYLADVFRRNAAAQNFRMFCPDETTSNRLAGVYKATEREWNLPVVATDEHLSRDGRVLEILSEHCCEGWLEGYVLTGRHGLFACYEAFVSIVDTMVFQYAKWQKMAAELPWRASTASLNIVLTSHVWEQDHNGYSHQGPTFINALMTKKSAQTRVFLPPDANCALHVLRDCLDSRGLINLIVTSKKPQLQWLDTTAAAAHCARGVSVWHWASDAGTPDVILAGCGDVPTREIMAAARLLSEAAPEFRLRIVNVVDLLRLESPQRHPRGMDEAEFSATFGEDLPVVFAFHGYPSVIQDVLDARPNSKRFDVHGYQEEGTTTTPFDMLVLNNMDRFHLAISALRCTARPPRQADNIVASLHKHIENHKIYIARHDEDMPAVMNWRWAT